MCEIFNDLYLVDALLFYLLIEYMMYACFQGQVKILLSSIIYCHYCSNVLRWKCKDCQWDYEFDNPIKCTYYRWRGPTIQSCGYSSWNEESRRVPQWHHVLRTYHGVWKVISLLMIIKLIPFSLEALLTLNIVFFIWRNDELELGSELFSQARKDGVFPNLIMCKCLTGKLCRFSN